MKVLENKKGYIANGYGIKNLIISDKVYLADNEDESRWKSISKREGDELLSLQEKTKDINTIEDIDKVITDINNGDFLPSIINEVPMTDNEALARKAYYPQWGKFIGKNLRKDFKVVYEDKLYKVRQEHLVQSQFFPSVETASLYEEINETHAGSKEDPIPYNNNMRLELGKFYSQKGKVYECIRDSGQPVYEDLSQLEGYGFVREVK